MRASPLLTVAAGTLTLCLAGALPAAAATSPTPPLPIPVPSPVGGLLDEVSDATGLPNPLADPTPVTTPSGTSTTSTTQPRHHRHHHATTTTSTTATQPAPARHRDHPAQQPKAVAPTSLPAGISRAWSVPQLPAASTTAPLDQAARPPLTAPTPADVTTAVLAAGRVPDLSRAPHRLLPGDEDGRSPRTLLLALATAAAVGLAVAHAKAAITRG